jgi:serine/threonine-protein kinase
VNPEVPKALDALVARLLTKDPDDRLGSAAELVDELGLVRKHLSQTLPTPQPPLPPSVPGGTGPRRRRRPVLALVALLVFLALLGALGWAFGVRASLEDARQALLGPQEVAVPDVEGLALDEARGRLRAKGFGTEVRRRQSSEEDSGRVLEQSVPGGRQVKEGSRILLAVGEGPRTVPDGGEPRREGVPDLVGLPYPEAEQALREAGFVLGGVVEEPSQTVSAGVILAQDPGAGDAAPPGSAVTLTTSTGAVSTPSSASPTAPASVSASPSP